MVRDRWLAFFFAESTLENRCASVYRLGWVRADRFGAWWVFWNGNKKHYALIPAFLGVGLVGAGLLAFKPALRKHAMHGAAMLSLVGLIGAGARAIPAVFNDASNLATSVYMQLAMMLVCLIFLIACIRSFIRARRG